ncbi:MAG TPA: hypothetical protein VJ910_08610 [Desulfuromonadales bacterium]|nr:hypothetical protein [Desulfuromonadales bacterium]
MTQWFEQSDLVALAEEKSVQGRVVKAALTRAAEADSEQAALIEEALQELLGRFQGSGVAGKS